MTTEPLQIVPLLNLVLHNAVFLVSVAACIFAFFLLHKEKKNNGKFVETWYLVSYGLLFYAISEYSDLFTPGLKASLGVHNYFTEGTLLVGVILIFIAIRRLIVSEIPKEETRA